MLEFGGVLRALLLGQIDPRIGLDIVMLHDRGVESVHLLLILRLIVFDDALIKRDHAALHRCLLPMALAKRWPYATRLAFLRTGPRALHVEGTVRTHAKGIDGR